MKKAGFLKNLLNDFLLCCWEVESFPAFCERVGLGEFFQETEGDIFRDERLSKLFLLKKWNKIISISLKDGIRD